MMEQKIVELQAKIQRLEASNVELIDAFALIAAEKFRPRRLGGHQFRLSRIECANLANMLIAKAKGGGS